MQKIHRPPHRLGNNGIYFLTASTFLKKVLFDDSEKKNMLKVVIKEKSSKFGVKIFAWVIMDSHYHLLIKIENDKSLPGFIKSVNGKSAFLLNQMGGREDQTVWYNYWDTCIREERDFWSRFNYIHHNPVKHKIAENMEYYEFSSYKAWLDKKGREWMDDVLESYPIVDFSKGDE